MLTGSSAMRSRGSRMRLRARAARWSWPPESCRGNLSKTSAGCFRPARGHGRRDPAPLLGPGRQPVNPQRLGKVAEDRQPGVHGAEGVLEDDLDLAAPLLQFAAGQPGQVPALEKDLSSAGRKQVGDDQPKGGFA